MVHLFCNTLFLLLTILGVVSCWSPHPEESGTSKTAEVKSKEIKFDCGYGCELGDWIRAEVPSNQPNGSAPAWAFFYFRVNGTGEVDSLYSRGTVRSEVSDKIKYNIIYRTKGRWKIPDGFRAKDYQWFVLPYFDLGEISCFSVNCSREDSIFQSSMTELFWSMGSLQKAVKDRHATIMPPADAGRVIPRIPKVQL